MNGRKVPSGSGTTDAEGKIGRNGNLGNGKSRGGAQNSILPSAGSYDGRGKAGPVGGGSSAKSTSTNIPFMPAKTENVPHAKGKMKK